MWRRFFFGFFTSLAFLAVSVFGQGINDCVREWQQPMMTRALIGQPSQPYECHPEGKRCPSGRNQECQFSFKRFKYVCCENRIGADQPECPRYHDTLLTFCETDSTCPRGYKCMGSRKEKELRLCCRPNSGLQYPEPETAFRDRNIVPRFLEVAPRTEAKVAFGDQSLVIGELVSISSTDLLSSPPVVSLNGLSDDKLYTVMLFDISAPQPVTIHWMLVNVQSIDGRLDINNKARTVVHYRAPDIKVETAGTHVMVVVVFEQKVAWQARTLARFDPNEVDIPRFVSDYADMLVKQPLGGSFYAFTTAPSR